MILSISELHPENVSFPWEEDHNRRNLKLQILIVVALTRGEFYNLNLMWRYALCTRILYTQTVNQMKFYCDICTFEIASSQYARTVILLTVTRKMKHRPRLHLRGLVKVVVAPVIALRTKSPHRRNR